MPSPVWVGIINFVEDLQRIKCRGMEILSSLPERHWSSLAFELDYTPAVFSWFSGLQTQTRTKVGGISWVFSLQTTDHRTSQLPSLREPIPYNKLPPIHTHTHSLTRTLTHTHSTLTHTHTYTHIPLVQFLWRTHTFIRMSNIQM